MSGRAWVVVWIVVAALLALGACMYGRVLVIGFALVAVPVAAIGAVRWLRRPKAVERPPQPPAEPPISYEDLRELFAWLGRPDPPDCTHTLKETEEFLASRQLPVAPTLEWLKANHGYCDCEVIFNVADRWGPKVGWSPRDEDPEQGEL